MAVKENPKRVKTGKFRVSYPAVFKPEKFDDAQDPKYKVTMLFPKNADLSALRKAIDIAAEEKFGTKYKDMFKSGKLKHPIQDGDRMEDTDGYAGHWFVRTSTTQKPQVIGLDKLPIEAETGDFYAGCFARATVLAYAFDGKTNKGVSLILCNVQKLDDGERFGGGASAEDDFDDEPEVDSGSESSEDSDDYDV